MDVSIIVLTYNADSRKLKKTLRAAAVQENVDFEILICDDGSREKDFSFLDGFMRELGVKQYRLIENPQNQGTVRNCLSGLQQARGEYVFFTSPGDLLYDSRVMADFCRFARENHRDLCFGSSVFYSEGETGPRLTRQYSVPANPGIYAGEGPGAKLSFMAGNWIIGAGYFRKREAALRYLEAAAPTSKYMEDTVSTFFALAQGDSVSYYDRNIIWYEDGTGISTGASKKWQRLLHEDLYRTLQVLKNQYPKDPCVDLAWCNASQPDRKKRLVRKMLRHPVLMVRNELGKRRFRPEPVSCSPEDLDRLKQMLRDR